MREDKRRLSSLLKNYPLYVFKQIFIDHWSEFQQMNPRYKTGYYDKTIKKMLGCGDPENGFISYRCLPCGEVLRFPLVARAVSVSPGLRYTRRSG